MAWRQKALCMAAGISRKKGIIEENKAA